MPPPQTAHAAAASHKQSRRSGNRIVPVVPLPFTRPAPSVRPLTPGESTAEPVARPDTEPAPEPAAGELQPKRSPAAVQTPPTPDSKAAGERNGGEVEQKLASSPAASHEDYVEKSLDSQVSGTHPDTASTNSVTPLPSTEPALASVDGRQRKAAARVELPPPFCPAEKPPVPAMNGVGRPFPPASAHVPPHRPRPSVEGLVFGAAQESPAIPSTPHETEPEQSAPQHAFARPPPGFGPPELTAPFFPGHTHHPSNGAMPWMQPSYSMALPDALYATNINFQQPTFASVPVTYDASLQNRETGVVNGLARSHSTSPNKLQFSDTQAGSEFEERTRALPYQNGTSLSAERSPAPWQMLRQWLSYQFGNSDLADYILHIRSEETVLLSMPVHTVLVTHNPVIADAIRQSNRSVPSPKERPLAVVCTADIFVDEESLREAIKLLYGADLLSPEALLYGIPPFHPNAEPNDSSEIARKRMDHAISYAAAGRALQIPSMHLRGLEMTRALIRWDTLEQALRFALYKVDSKPSLDGRGRKPSVPDAYEGMLLSDVINFMAQNFPTDFSFYTIAPELSHNPRLPNLGEFRHSAHNPKLSMIRFGDAPIGGEQVPSYAIRLLSGVLLSLSPNLLERLFNHPATANKIGWTRVAKIMREVVEEREKRRQKILSMQTKPAPDRPVPASLMDNLSVEERIEDSNQRPTGQVLSTTPLTRRS